MNTTFKIVNLIPPKADAFAGTVTTDPINLKNYGQATFIITKGAGVLGTSTITVESCADITGTNPVAVVFKYAKNTATDTWGSLTNAETTGFVTDAGADQAYKIEVDASVLGKTENSYIRIKAVEVVNDPVVGGVTAFLTEGRFTRDNPTTVLA